LLKFAKNLIYLIYLAKLFNNIPMKKVVGSFFCFAIFLAGCGSPINPVGDVSNLPGNNPVSEKAAEALGEQIAEEMMGGVDMEFAEEGSGEVVAWPENMPSDVPVFEYGIIDVSMVSPTGEGEDSVVVSLIEVEQGAYDKYEQDLESSGWTITTDPAWTDEHISAEKGSRTIDVDVDPMGENTAFLYYFGE
jgi:hypothetical protein